MTYGPVGFEDGWQIFPKTSAVASYCIGKTSRILALRIRCARLFLLKLYSPFFLEE